MDNNYKEFLNHEIDSEIPQSDATASAFGWNFQVYAGIFLALNYIKQIREIIIESPNQDIEIRLKNKIIIFAQAKSSKNPETKDVSVRNKDAIVSLAQAHRKNSKLIYISNFKNPFKTDDDFKNVVRSYNDCLDSTKQKVDTLINKIINDYSVDDIKINEKQQKKRMLVVDNLTKMDKKDISFSAITNFYGNNEKNRRESIAEKAMDILCSDFKLNRNIVVSHKTKILDDWYHMFDLNSTIDNTCKEKPITVSQFMRPVLNCLLDDVSVAVNEFIGNDVEIAARKEAVIFLKDEKDILLEDFENISSIISDYYSFKKNYVGKNTEKNFISNNWTKYFSFFKKPFDYGDTRKCIIQAIVFCLISDYENVNKITEGVKNDN